MMRFFFALYLLSFHGAIPPIEFNNSNEVQKVVQSVLEIDEFNQYLNRTPRFISSNRSPLYLLQNKFVPKDIDLNVNNIPVMLLNPELQKTEDYKFFLKIEELKMGEKKSSLRVTYKNSKLLYEEQKEIMLAATLKKSAVGDWKVMKYNLQKISISD